MRLAEITSPLPLPATPEHIAQAKQFVLRKWQERATEHGHDNIPGDLSDACKFASLFAQRIFGGQLRGNWHHQYVVLPDGRHLDLTEPSQNLADIIASGRNPYQHDKAFWNNREHRASMASCKPRVDGWVTEFLNMLNEAIPGGTRSQWAYHGTLMEHVPSIAQFGLQSNHRPKWSWDDSKQRKFHLLYFSLTGPQGWGIQKNVHAQSHELVELRFPLTALKRIRWQEDEERPERDEYYAVSRHEFIIAPEHIQILRGQEWLPVQVYYRDFYGDA